MELIKRQNAGDFGTETTGDLGYGKSYEYVVKEWLERAGWEVELNEAKDLDGMQKFDLVARKGAHKELIEVKRDSLTTKYRRIAVDMPCLRHTQAAYWIFCCGDDDNNCTFYSASTKDLNAETKQPNEHYYKPKRPAGTYGKDDKGSNELTCINIKHRIFTKLN